MDALGQAWAERHFADPKNLLKIIVAFLVYWAHEFAFFSEIGIQNRRVAPFFYANYSGGR